MKKYRVEFANDGPRLIHADEAVVDNGHLILRDYRGLISAYAPGQWIACEEMLEPGSREAAQERLRLARMLLAALPADDPAIDEVQMSVRICEWAAAEAESRAA